MQSIKNNNRKDFGSQKKLNASSLAGLGIGSIIGSGFFLGSAISIHQAGPAAVIAFLICGFLFSQVLGAMTSISINRPITGSFKVYAEQYLGKYVGFLIGWILFFSNILAIGSEAVAAGIFLRFWFPKIPVAPLACGIMILVVSINRLNMKNFSLVESCMAIMKILALLFFIVVGVRFLFLHGLLAMPSPFHSIRYFFPNGTPGFLSSMLVVIFTYAGVSTVAMATSKVEEPAKDIPKATIIMACGTVSLYTLTIFLIICLLPWNSVNTDISPLIQAFNQMGFQGTTSFMNIVIVVAALSVMIGSYFGSVQVLASLSQAGEAPEIFGQTDSSGFYRSAWRLTGGLSLLVVAISFALSHKLFNYLISASSFFTFLNWSINLVIYWKWIKQRDVSEKFSSPLIWGRAGAGVTLIALLILTVVSLYVKDFRIGFYIAVSIYALISVAYLWQCRKQKKSYKS